LALERSLLNPSELPDGDVRVPIQLLSQECPVAPCVSRSQVREFLAHQGGVTCMAIGPRSLVTGGRDHAIRVWDSAAYQELMKLSGDRDLVGALAPLWEQARILSVGWDATVRAWNLQTGDVIACLEPTGDKLFSVESVVRLPSSDDVVIGFGLYDYCLGIWNINRPTDLDKWGSQKDAILDLDLSAERRQLLAAI